MRKHNLKDITTTLAAPHIITPLMVLAVATIWAMLYTAHLPLWTYLAVAAIYAAALWTHLSTYTATQDEHLTGPAPTGSGHQAAKLATGYTYTQTIPTDQDPLPLVIYTGETVPSEAIVENHASIRAFLDRLEGTYPGILADSTTDVPDPVSEGLARWFDRWTHILITAHTTGTPMVNYADECAEAIAMLTQIAADYPDRPGLAAFVANAADYRTNPIT